MQMSHSVREGARVGHFEVNPAALNAIELQPPFDSSHSGRRTFAGKVMAMTGDMDTVALLLGHASIDCTQRYIDVSQDKLRAMFADAI